MKDANVVVKLPKKSDDHPVAMLVQIASRYESRIYMADGPRMGMMALGLNDGKIIEVSADGNDEEDALHAITGYLTGVAV